jgi:pimeloyl-ACP methyl ester carboxylesterase
MSASLEIATIAGRNCRFIEAGDRAADRVVVLLHAFPLGVGMFDPQRDALAGWRIVIPALPGFDGSDLLDRPFIDDYARHVVALLDHLNVERAVLAGVSLGGYLIFGILRHALERVSAVVLADTRSAGDTDTARAGRERLLHIAHGSGPKAVGDDMLPKLLGTTSQRTQPELVTRVRQLIEAQTTEGIVAAIHVLMTRPDSTPLLGTLNIPALVVVGKEDVLTPPEEMERMAAAMPQARFVELEGAGHLSNMERPDAFNREVRDFLQNC